MKLTAFRYGTTEITSRMAFQEGNSDEKIPISLMFFLIETGNRKILVDAGCDTMPGFTLYEFQKPVSLLEEYGISREDITDVIITHAHHDHIDCVKYYNNANIYLHEYEIEKANEYLSCSEKLTTFDGDFEIDENICIVHVGGHSKGSCIVIIKADEHKYVLCGDECYTKENLSQGKPTGSSCCLEKSIAFVEKYRNSVYKTILFHDAELVTEIGFKRLI